MRGDTLIITISGIDCSGKSTQLDLLRERFTEKGMEARLFWFRPGYSAELDLLRAWVRRVRPGLLPRTTADEREARDAVFKKPAVRRGWAAMALGDIWLQYVVKLRAQDLLGRIVLCDRYLFDARLDLELRFPDLARTLERIFSTLERMAPRPDHAFLLMLPYEEMMRRMDAKKEPFPDPEDLRRARFDRYLVAGARRGITVIDANRDRESVADDIWERVCASLR